MADTTSDTDLIKDRFEEEHLQKHLEDITRNELITNPKYSINFGSKKGDNYISIVYRVIIEGEKNGEKVKMHFIFKCSPKDESQRELLQIRHFFPREVFFYQKITPVFSQLLQEHDLTISGIPMFYGANEENHKEVIILEDLREKGFIMRDRIKGLDYSHASLAIRHLGRLHAYSFALRDQKPDVFRKLSEITETFFRPDLSKEGLFVENTNNLGDHVKIALAEEKPYYVERFIAFFERLWENLEKCCNGDLAEPYAVINHGDFWTNNMLFRYNEDSSEPQDFYFLDFQIARYASPALDIVYLLFCSCNQELRSKYYDQLILEYHNSLSECLIELGSDPKRLFPFVALTDQLKEFGKFGAGMAMFTVIGFTAKDEDILDVTDFGNNLSKMKNRIETDRHYRNTLRDIFKDMIDRNYI